MSQYIYNKYSKVILVLLFASIHFQYIFSQEVITLRESIIWENLKEENHQLKNDNQIPWFKGALRTQYDLSIPVFLKKIPLRNWILPEVSVTSLATKEHIIIESELIQEEIKIWYEVVQERSDIYLVVTLVPIVHQNGYTRLVESFELNVILHNDDKITRGGGWRNQEFKSSSVLANGIFQKIGVKNSGITRLSHDFITGTLGISTNQLTTNSIKIYGNRGGILEEEIARPRIDDLEEIPYILVGGDDGRFDNGDYILFYAEGSSTYKMRDELYTFQNGIYDEYNYFFITNNSLEKKSIGMTAQPTVVEREFNSYTSHQRWEEDKVNLLDEFVSAQGSGKDWYSDYFGDVARSRNYTERFDPEGFVLGKNLMLRLAYAGRSITSHSLSGVFNGTNFNIPIAPVNTANIEALYARRVTQTISSPFTGTSDVEITLEISGASNAEGWLDYLELIGEKRLEFNGNTLRFYHTESGQQSRVSYTIANATSNLHIWDITDPLNTNAVMPSLESGSARFSANTDDRLKEYIVFDPGISHPLPEYIGTVPNQNIHSINEAELAIIYHPDFENAALKLMNHRVQNGIQTIAVSTDKLFNEFAGGKRDVTGIRDFSRMLYKRSPSYQYLLLMGDASFDYKHIGQNYPDHNFVPAYQTSESLHPIEAFPADDFYGLLSDNEGSDLRGQLEIGVGRLPAKTAEEAEIMVNKIIMYETDPQALGDWRLRIGFSADDGDFNTHFRQAERISGKTELKFPLYNQQKIYFDAYVRESTSGGGRYPGATQAINNNILKGLLVLNYLGHGGPKGWAQERVLQVRDIQSWDNPNKLPLLITATCSFTAYDDPRLESAGEISIVREKGGAIGLMTTVRAVFSLENERLTAEVFDTLFSLENLQSLKLGEIMRRAKNNNWQDTIRVNARKFALIADPSMSLAIPKHKILVTSINDIPLESFTDTIGALQHVKISGIITNQTGQVLNNFHGTVFPTVFDKKSKITTLGNEPRSRVEDFELFSSILFKGSATVSSGLFDFDFIVPSDINYTPGFGRISLYATNTSNEDAGGFYNQMTIGGAASSEIADKEGPVIDLFINDENFITGGITNTSPNLIIKLFDESGINVTGAGIGHDLTAVLDGDEQNPIILNEFYVAEKDNFKAGSVEFPLHNLSPGHHTLTVKAWDVVNNSSESYIEFRVIESEDGAIERVFNFPNPFSTNTEFMFEHDLAGTELDILLRIYTISGKIVKTIEHTIFSPGNRISEIYWDGRDDYGDKLGIGVYPYKILVKDKESGLKRESKFQKLVLIR